MDNKNTQQQQYTDNSNTKHSQQLGSEPNNLNIDHSKAHEKIQKAVHTVADSEIGKEIGLDKQKEQLTSTLQDFYGKLSEKIKNTDNRVLLASAAGIILIPLGLYQLNRRRIDKKNVFKRVSKQILSSVVVAELLDRSEKLMKKDKIESRLGNYLFTIKKV